MNAASTSLRQAIPVSAWIALEGGPLWSAATVADVSVFGAGGGALGFLVQATRVRRSAIERAFRIISNGTGHGVSCVHRYYAPRDHAGQKVRVSFHPPSRLPSG